MFNNRNFIITLGYFLSIFSIISGFYAFFIDPPAVLIRDSGAQQWEERMKPVKVALPDDVQELGYISDVDLLADPTWEQAFTEVDEFPLTMYSMIPRLVRHGTSYEWIIGNFTNEEFQFFLDENLLPGYELQSMGFGIYLIHNKP